MSNAYEKTWILLYEIREVVVKAIEPHRENKLIKHSLEAHILISINEMDEYPLLLFFFAKLKNQTAEDFLQEFFIVSKVTMVTDGIDLEETKIKGLCIKVERAEGSKCLRCWHWHESFYRELCPRCEVVIA
jgi:isoleucyl-tRNA synthetase